MDAPAWVVSNSLEHFRNDPRYQDLTFTLHSIEELHAEDNRPLFAALRFPARVWKVEARTSTGEIWPIYTTLKEGEQFTRTSFSHMPFAEWPGYEYFKDGTNPCPLSPKAETEST